MFETLTQRLQVVFRAFRSKGRLTESDVRNGLREIRIALLEADVNLGVVKDFLQGVSERAQGQEVTKSLTPGQQVVKIVHEELVKLLGSHVSELHFNPVPPTVILMLGLQGGGKTTTCGKVALWVKKRGRSPLLVATDLRRPAAIEQLKIVGEKVGIPVFAPENARHPAEIAREAVSYAQGQANDIVIVDTGGRLQTDEELMEELTEIEGAVSPHESLIVVDAMTGQEAVNVAREFCAHVNVTGIVLTKLDGDARGGAALSISSVTGKSIKFVGVGEQYDALEVFHPERMASRILGMGDVLTLIERAQETFEQEQMETLAKKMTAGALNLDDFLVQLRQLRKMGPLEQVLSMIPGLGKMLPDELDETGLSRIEAIVLSMTPEERHNPEILGSSRKRRIARGSGTSIAEVNRLLKDFKAMSKMTKGMKPEKLKRSDLGRLLIR